MKGRFLAYSPEIYRIQTGQFGKELTAITRSIIFFR